MGIIIGSCVLFVALVIYLTKGIVNDMLKTNDNLYEQYAKVESHIDANDDSVAELKIRVRELEEEVKRLSQNKPHITFNDEEFTV